MFINLQDVIAEPFVPLTEEEQDEVSCALSKSNRYDLYAFHFYEAQFVISSYVVSV